MAEITEGMTLAEVATLLNKELSEVVDALRSLKPAPVSEPTPTPEPVKEPTPMPTRPWIWATVGHGESRATPNSVRVVQDALKREFPIANFHDEHGVYWGRLTRQAYRWWQEKLGFRGGDANGTPGKTSLTKLGQKQGFDIRGEFPASDEPAHDYGRTTYGGKTVNKRTRDMLVTAASVFGSHFGLTQGSYNRGVSASAGTHDGGGVVDINVDGMTSAKRNALVLALRRAGFAAWLRTPAQGFSYHIHANAIGDREMASLAKSQVQSYFNGRNGLAGNGYDGTPRPHPPWANRYDF